MYSNLWIVTGTGTVCMLFVLPFCIYLSIYFGFHSNDTFLSFFCPLILCLPFFRLCSFYPFSTLWLSWPDLDLYCFTLHLFMITQNVVVMGDHRDLSSRISLLYFPFQGDRFPYTRPHFLQLGSEDEIQVTADHGIRPIICPRDISRFPWKSGYAEWVH